MDCTNESPYAIELRFDAKNPIAAKRLHEQITLMLRQDDRIDVKFNQLRGKPEVVGNAWMRRMKGKAHATRVRVHGREMAHAMRSGFDR